MCFQVNSDLEEANNLAMKAAESVKEQRLSRDLEIQRRLNLRNHGDTISITSSQSLPVTHNVNGHVMSNSGSHGVSGHGNNINNNTTSPFGSHSHHPHFGNHFATSGGAGIPGNAVGTPSSPSVTPQTPPTSSTTSSRRVSPMSITSSSSVGMGGAQMPLPPGGGVNVSTPPSATSSPSPGGQTAMTSTPSPRVTPGNAPPSYPIKTSPGSISAPGTFQAYETSTSHPRDATQRHDVTSLDQTSQVDDSVDEFTRVSPCVSRHAFATNSPEIFHSRYTMRVAQNCVVFGKIHLAYLLRPICQKKCNVSLSLFIRLSSKNTNFRATLYPTTPFVL